MALQNLLLRTIKNNNLFPLGGQVVVGVSGGADSLALLHALVQLRDRLDCTFHAATLDHGLRGDDGAEDARFVVDLCAAWGVPVTAGKVDVAALAAAEKLGIEAAARLARYRFLAQVARDVGATHVAVAHHADDQAETVLMRLLRGAWLAGLSGMALKSAVPDAPDLTLVRPFLYITRAQIEAYCREHDLTPRQDATNLDTAYTRNYLRHTVLPMLEQVNPQARRALGQLADLAAVDDDYLENALANHVLPYVIHSADAILLPREVFRNLHPALQRRFVVWAAAQLRGDDGDETGSTHVLAAVEVVRRGRLGARALLPGSLHVRVDYQMIAVEAQDHVLSDAGLRLLAPDDEIPVVVPGDTPAGAWTLRATFEPMVNHAFRAALTLSDAGRVVLRTRRRGDRFAPPGMGGHTTPLSEWMIDRKIPRHLRDRIPLLVVDGQIAVILWGDAWTINDHLKLRDKEDRVLYLFDTE